MLLILFIIVFLCACVGSLTYYYMFILIRKTNAKTRAHMDTLPLFLRSIWPLISFLQFYILQIVPTESLLKQKRKLDVSGQSFLLKAEDFIALQVVSTILLVCFWLVIISLLQFSFSANISLFFFFAIFGWFYPNIWLNDKRKKRNKEILRALPSFLDLITLCCQAGLSLTGSIAQAVDKGPKGALRDEFDRMLRDMRAGMNRTDSFRAMADRTDNENIKSLISSIVQAESLGASIASTLADISDQRRTERFQSAEKLAMEAPVKMIAPLIIFIFPVTFIIIFFPIVMQFMQSSN